MAADAATATVKVARRINGSRNISRGISESSSPRISRNRSSISRGISSNNSSISRGISESSSPRNSSIISSGTSNISNRSRNSSTSPYSIQGDGVHPAFVSSVVNTGIFCRSAVQYPPRVFLTRTRARKLRLIHILKTTSILGAVLHHHSQPPRRRTSMDRPFRPGHPGAPSVNRPPWRNLRRQASLPYRIKAW